jgi:hypothetical protein
VEQAETKNADNLNASHDIHFSTDAAPPSRVSVSFNSSTLVRTHHHHPSSRAPKVTDTGKHIVWKEVISTLKDFNLILLGILFFLLLSSSYILIYYLPAIIQDFGYSNLHSVLLTTPIYVFKTIIDIGNSFHSDWKKERKYHIVFPSLFAGILYIVTALVMKYSTLDGLKLFILFLGGGLSGCSMSPFLSLLVGDYYTSRTASATAISLVVCLGSIGGFAGPTFFAWTYTTYGTYFEGLLFLSIPLFLFGVGTWFVVERLERQRNTAVSNNTADLHSNANLPAPVL